MAAPRRLRHAAVLAVVAVTVALAVPAARRASDLIGAASFVSPAHPWVRLDREITAEFGFERPVVWVIAAPQETVWSPEHLRQVQALTAAVLRIPGVIALDVISLASPNLRDLQVTEFGLRPTYLMAEVPTTPEGLEGLRRRVDTDPNYRGNLVSLDGRAAMVVANFRRDADARVVGGAARALQATHRDARTQVYVAGLPLIETMQLPLHRGTLAGVALALLAAGVALWAGLGARDGSACVLAALLAAVWTATGMAAAGLAQLPWTLYAVPYAAALAAGAAVLPRDGVGWRQRCMLGASLAAAFATMWVWLDAPARPFATAGGAASMLAMLASGLCAPAAESSARGRASACLAGRGRGWRLAVAALIAGAALGLPHLRTSLGLAGYGQRYLPGAEGRDLRAIARYFPPPTALAFRVRGAPRFVTSPAVLRAFDDVVVPVRAEPSVVSAMSLADLVKLVHRAFNDNDAAFAAIPDDEGLIARYLTLAYSPGFRRFIDRALATAAIWIYVGDDDPGHLRRVLARVHAQLAVHPVPDADVDLIGGDGAQVLLMAATLRSLALGTGAWLGCALAVLALLCGWRAALRGVLGGAAAVVVMSGSCAWLDLPLDLVSVPLLVSITTAGTALAVLSGQVGAARLRALGLALTLAAVPALLSTYAGAQLLGSAGLTLGIVAGAFPAPFRQCVLVCPSERVLRPTAPAAVNGEAASDGRP